MVQMGGYDSEKMSRVLFGSNFCSDGSFCLFPDIPQFSNVSGAVPDVVEVVCLDESNLKP